MIACGICLHNIPEGMLLGASFETEGTFGVMLALAIALHNIPAGIGIAMPLQLAGMELLPEAREKSNHWANVGIATGVLLFLFLETV